jgi:hypothetical protein
LAGSLVSKTFLFIGFSFTDPNLDYVLSRIRVSYNSNMRSHYGFFKKVNRKDFNTDDEYKYALTKQELFIGDLLRFNINAILVDEYRDIDEILKDIENRYKRKTVFISGAAHDYSPWSQKNASDLIQNLSKEIIRKNYKIVSGFGLGVGSAVISGALEEIYLNPRNNNMDQLILRPFPQTSGSSVSLDVLWEYYRDDMCDHSGVAVFLFGNKFVDPSVVNSDGLMKEFEIAVKKNLFIIPIGITGFMAKIIYDIVAADLNSYKYKTSELRTAFHVLGSSNNTDEIIKTVMKILDEITK